MDSIKAAWLWIAVDGVIPYSETKWHRPESFYGIADKMLAATHSMLSQYCVSRWW